MAPRARTRASGSPTRRPGSRARCWPGSPRPAPRPAPRSAPRPPRRARPPAAARRHRRSRARVASAGSVVTDPEVALGVAGVVEAHPPGDEVALGQRLPLGQGRQPRSTPRWCRRRRRAAGRRRAPRRPPGRRRARAGGRATLGAGADRRRSISGSRDFCSRGTSWAHGADPSRTVSTGALSTAPPPCTHRAVRDGRVGPMAAPQRFLTLPEVAEVLNTSVAQVYALVRRGDLVAMQDRRPGPVAGRGGQARGVHPAGVRRRRRPHRPAPLRRVRVRDPSPSTDPHPPPNRASWRAEPCVWRAEPCVLAGPTVRCCGPNRAFLRKNARLAAPQRTARPTTTHGSAGHNARFGGPQRTARRVGVRGGRG